MDPRVLDAMLPHMSSLYGNPHSITHMPGRNEWDEIEKARTHVSKLINASNKEVIFTSGATESNNLAITGLAEFAKGSKKLSKKNHIITSQIEHKCVLECYRNLSLKGYNITHLKVDKNGLIDLNELADIITDKTLLVSVMTVNNEIGSIQPMQKIGEICNSKDV